MTPEQFRERYRKAKRSTHGQRMSRVVVVANMHVKVEKAIKMVADGMTVTEAAHALGMHEDGLRVALRKVHGTSTVEKLVPTKDTHP